MAKFRVTVTLPAAAQADPLAAIAEAMRPFDMNVDPATGGDGFNPQGEWDWWQISSYDNLVVLPAHDGDPRLIHQAVRPNGEPRPRGSLRCDGGPRGLLDLDGMRAISAADAAATWAVWARFAAQHPPAEPRSAFLARYGVDAEAASPDLERAKREHLAQPLVQALAQYAVTGGDEHYPNSFVMHDPVALFSGTEQEYVERAAAVAVPTTALLTLDGQWADQWNARPLGEVRPEESEGGAYWRLADAYLRGLPEDALLVQLLCHC
ncbi:hypothetical protein [Kitasatospora sp. NBC_01302]|uniref:hypothetical protein n=1 Tax=Kitasatospora sp. NBC_01302 TaxID=2903575 RepID=UPI002E0EDD2A|nr:hypothetical protein OG294_12630 [Kitasatospora sp. NBC_01302]